MGEEKKPIERCFWCGKPKDKDLRDIEETEETLKNSVIMDYRPCETCKEYFGDGIHVIGVTKEPIIEGMFPISRADDGDEEKDLYPTGSMFIANESFIKDMVDDNDELLEQVLKEKIMMIPEESCSAIVQQIEAERLKESESNETRESFNKDLESVGLKDEEDV